MEHTEWVELIKQFGASEAEAEFFAKMMHNDTVTKTLEDIRALLKDQRERTREEITTCQQEHNEARHGNTPDDAYDRVLDLPSLRIIQEEE